MAQFSQDARMGRLVTVLGKDALVLQRFSGTERLSDLFDWRVDCLAQQSDLDVDALLGTHATVILESRSGPRFYDGIVTELRWLGAGENGQRHALRLQPWFHLAKLRRNQRIFHDKSVLDIVREVLADHEAAGRMIPQLSESYPALEYTVQFRESDFAFVSRMLERHGITYRFDHAEGRHDMVLTDMVESHPGIGDRPFHPDEGQHQEEIEHFWQWRPARRITTGAIKLTDYNFKTPNAAMQTDETGDAAHAQGMIESYDWPGDYLDRSRGRAVVRLRTKSERGQAPRFEAEGDIPALAAGRRVTLTGDQVPGLGEDFLCLAATHSYTSDNYGTGGPAGDGLAFRASYVLLPVTAPMLPELKTPRADVRGPQTAKVVGEGEIDCDEYGRILVQFHWDLTDARSMRCRVAQNWSGAGWGGMVLPRVGMEVLVEFLDGDPDQPLVTGCVYNGVNPVPYPLPAHKTKAVWRSKTHQGQGHNEISFEDATGAENIALHAQKDMTLKVLNNRMQRVDNDAVSSTGRNVSIETGKNHQERIGGSMNLSVGGANTGLFAALAGVLGGGATDALNVAGEAGDATIPAFLGGIVAATVGGEIASAGKIAAFDAAGEHKAVAGLRQVETGTALGSVLSSVMPVSGVMNTVIEKFQADTIGLARSEQIGLFKNTMVGAVQNTLVGKKQFTKIGEEQRLMVGKTKTAEIGTEYTTHAGQRSAHSSGKLFQISTEEKFEGTAKVWEIKAEDTLLLSAPGGYVEISKSGVRIRGLKVLIEGTAIDFKSGGPGEGSKCLRAMAASATPFVR